jgi:hypothetical protein
LDKLSQAFVGARKADGIPNTDEERLVIKHTEGFKNKETRNLRKADFTSKVVNPLHVLSSPLLQGDE